MLPKAVVALDLARVTFPGFHPLAGRSGVVRAFLILREQGHLLVDTGVGFGSAEIDRWYAPRRIPIVEALAAKGVSPRSIVAIVHTHLHFDHIGQDEALPGVPVYLQAAEVPASAAEHYTVRAWLPSPARVVAVTGDRTIVPGVHLIATPGHTPGHQSVAVDTDHGTVLIAGQAFASMAEYRDIAATRSLTGSDVPPDPAAYLASALRLVDMQAMRVLCSHDTEEIASRSLS